MLLSSCPLIPCSLVQFLLLPSVRVSRGPISRPRCALGFLVSYKSAPPSPSPHRIIVIQRLLKVTVDRSFSFFFFPSFFLLPRCVRDTELLGRVAATRTGSYLLHLSRRSRRLFRAYVGDGGESG